MWCTAVYMVDRGGWNCDWRAWRGKKAFFKKREEKKNEAATLRSVPPSRSPCRDWNTSIIHNFLSSGRELASDSERAGGGGETAEKIMTNGFPWCPEKCESVFERGRRGEGWQTHWWRGRERERERERERKGGGKLSQQSDTFPGDQKPASTGGLPERWRLALPLCHLSALFVYRQNTVDRAH